MSIFERILRDAEAAKRAKLAAIDLEKGFEWYRKPDIWEDIGDCDYRPTEYEALAILQERYKPTTIVIPVAPHSFEEANARLEAAYIAS